MERRRRGRLWIRWAGRDARRLRNQVLSIALLLGLGVGMYAAMSSMSTWRVRSADKSFAAMRMHDLRVALVEGGSVPEGTLRRALATSPARADVAAASERLVTTTQVDASRGGRTIIVPGRIVGTPPGSAVDRVHARLGRVPPPESGAVALEHNFARHYDLPATGELTLAGGVRARYEAQVLAPEYFVVTMPGAEFGAESAFAVVFGSLATAQRLAQRPGEVNELVLRVRAAADPAAVRAALEPALERGLDGAGFSITARADEPAHRLIYEDSEGDQQMLDIFAALLLGAATFAAFNLISRTVEAQRREIGIGMALGVAPWALARRPFLLAGQIALLGVALGVPVGLAADAWLAGVVDEFFPLPVIEADFQLRFYAEAAALGLALPLLAAAIPVRRALRVSPVEAIRVGARAARSSGLAWIARGVRLPGGTLANLPLRNVLRTPRRTVMTLLGIAAVVSIVIALAGMIDSFDRTLDATRAEALAGAHDRLTVDLAAPETSSGRGVRAIAAAASVGATQPSLRLASTLASGGERIDVALEVVADQRPLWQPTLAAGSLPRDGDGVVIARRAAEQLSAGVGDRVDVIHPVPGPDGTFRLVRTPLRVAGIHASPLRFLAYASEDTARALGVPGLVNRVSVTPATGHDADDVKAELLLVPGVAAVQGAAATTDAIDRKLDQFDEILVVTVLIAAAMALLIAFNASAINADERVREHATMFAQGVTVARVTRGAIAEAAIIGAMGTAAGVLAGRALLAWIVDTNMPQTMPDVGVLVAVSVLTYLAAVAAGVVVVAATPLLTVRRMTRADLPGTLRVVE